MSTKYKMIMNIVTILLILQRPMLCLVRVKAVGWIKDCCLYSFTTISLNGSSISSEIFDSTLLQDLHEQSSWNYPLLLANSPFVWQWGDKIKQDGLLMISKSFPPTDMPTVRQLRWKRSTRLALCICLQLSVEHSANQITPFILNSPANIGQGSECI